MQICHSLSYLKKLHQSKSLEGFCSGAQPFFPQDEVLCNMQRRFGMQLCSWLQVIFYTIPSHVVEKSLSVSLMNDWTLGPFFFFLCDSLNPAGMIQRSAKVKPTMSWGLWWTGDALHNIICTKPPLWVTVPTVRPTERHNETLSIRPLCPSVGGHTRPSGYRNVEAVDNCVAGSQSVNKTWTWWMCWDAPVSGAARLSEPCDRELLSTSTLGFCLCILSELQPCTQTHQHIQCRWKHQDGFRREG